MIEDGSSYKTLCSIGRVLWRELTTRALLCKNISLTASLVSHGALARLVRKSSSLYLKGNWEPGDMMVDLQILHLAKIVVINGLHITEANQDMIITNTIL